MRPPSPDLAFAACLIVDLLGTLLWPKVGFGVFPDMLPVVEVKLAVEAITCVGNVTQTQPNQPCLALLAPSPDALTQEDVK